MNRKILFGVFLVLCLISLTAINAQEVNITDVSETGNNIEEINYDDADILKQTNDDELSAGKTIYISPNGTGSGSSEEDPTNWDSAIYTATSGDVIQFSNGTFTNIKGNIYNNIELKGSGNTTLDAEQNDGFFKTYAGSTVTINDLSFINAYTGDKQGSPDGQKTGFDGEGAIVNNGVLIVNNCYFASNSGIGTEGGAIHNSGTCYVYNSTFFRNSGKKGGAIYSDKNSILYLYNSVFNKGVSKEGTAFNAKEAYVEMHNCIIANSSAKSGLISIKKSNVYIYDSSFYNSKAVDTAGVINVDKESTVYVDNCKFDKLNAAGTKLWFHNENGTGNGGAIVVEKEATITIKNSVFTNCQAVNDGGAILIQSKGTATIDNCTFKSNNASYGSHIYNYGTVTVTNSLIEVKSTIETTDIDNGQVETVKVTMDDGTYNVNINPNVKVLIDNADSGNTVSNGNVNLNNLAEGKHTVSLDVKDTKTTNSYIFTVNSSTFNVGKVAEENNTPADNKTDSNSTDNSVSDNKTDSNSTDNSVSDNKTDSNSTDNSVSDNKTDSNSTGNVTNPDVNNGNVTDSNSTGNVTNPDVNNGNVTDSNSTGNVTKPDVNAGNSTGNVTDNNQLKEGVSSDIKVDKNNVIITIDASSNATGNVTIIVDHKEVVSGSISDIKNKTIENLTAGAHLIQVMYSGDSNYSASKNIKAIAIDDTVTPAKKDTVIIADAVLTRTANEHTKTGENGTDYTVTLTDSDGNVLANKTIQIAINGVHYEVVTDSDGKAHQTVNMESANVYTYAFAFQGDDDYNASPLTSTRLTVTKKATTITAASKSFKKSATKKLTVTLGTVKNADGKTYLASGKKITLKVNGKTYTGKTNAKNQVTFTIKLTKKGTFKAKVSFAGSKIYAASSKKINIIIK